MSQAIAKPAIAPNATIKIFTNPLISYSDFPIRVHPRKSAVVCFSDDPMTR